VKLLKFGGIYCSKCKFFENLSSLCQDLWEANNGTMAMPFTMSIVSFEQKQVA